MNNSRTCLIVWISLWTTILFVGSLSGQVDKNIEVIKRSKTSNQDFEINIESLRIITQFQPEVFYTHLADRNGALIEIKLYKTTISRKEIKNIAFYQGHLVGHPESLISLTIHPLGIRGFISDSFGNITIQTNESGYVKTGSENKNNANKQWVCETSASLDKYEINLSKKSSLKSLSADTIGIYFMCDYELFELHGFSSSATLLYVYDLFNQVKAIYNQEQIEIIIEDIFIWESPDPFDESSAESSLLSFRNYIGENYPGHFAHLLSGTAAHSGGIAFINGLCNRSKSYGYSNVDGSIGQPGAYSWDVHVVTHELGHNMGSPHTHDCAWGPNGTDAIDACGSPAPECDDAPIPSEGGTIMSYCHTSPVGVNFSLGFGQEPGDRIRQTINLCQPTEGTSCELAFVIQESGTFVTGNLDNGSGAHHTGSTHAKWYKYSVVQNSIVSIRSCGQNVDTRLFLYSGTCSQLNELASSDDDCFSGSGYNYASKIENFEVAEGTSLFIEWDDRWSSTGFEFIFSITENLLPSCTNGIMDGNETGIDCGGSCTPCYLTCEDSIPLPEVIDTSIAFITQQTVEYSGIVHAPATLQLVSGLGIDINNGFEITTGAQLEGIIETCNN